ncbi:aldo-keto reductase [Moniliophthora roreri]|nr:aldo-keto reductase [Moniliophthora roreri]
MPIGTIKYLGLSKYTTTDLCGAHAVHPISTIQVKFSPLVLDIEDEQLVILKTAMSPLLRIRHLLEASSPDNKLYGDFEDDFRPYISQAQSHDFDLILGTKEIKYLEENMGAALLKLDTEEIAAIRRRKVIFLAIVMNTTVHNMT